MNNNLELRNVTKAYSGFKLDGISFDVPKGTVMGLIGENGAGKTTIIKLILNLIKKDHGDIAIFGSDNISNEFEIKKEIGVVLDESIFHDALKASTISNMMRSFYKNWDENLFFRYLKQFEIPINLMFKEYSKGMKMKLSLAVALSHGAKLLILDEPTSGLDPIIRNEILDVFLEFIMNEENSILISSHITSDLEKIADYITFIDKGRVVLSENKDELLNEYCILKCGQQIFDKIDKKDVISMRRNQFGYELLVKNREKMSIKYEECIIDSVNLEDIMLFTVKGEKL